MTHIEETAAAGSTTASSIAVVPGNRLGGMQSRMSLKDFMLKFHKNVKNGIRGYRPVVMEGSITAIHESTSYPNQLANATSQFKDMQGKSEYEDADIISYGVEDDTGNLMLLTVPMEQSEEFERRVAQSLADVLDFKKTGHGEDKTLAELLYELKDEFNIIDARFPIIPKDAVYNADEISTLPEADGGLGGEEGGLGGEEGGLGGEEGDLGGEDELGGEEGDLGGEDELGGEEGDLGGEDELGDDFDETPDKESLLTSVLGMIKSQNEKEIAQADAEKEKQRTIQAELALKSSKNEMIAQEEMITTQAEMDAEKDKEKRAKEMANMAKFNFKKRQGKGVREGFSSTFLQVIMELDDNISVATASRMKGMVARNYSPDKKDPPDKQAHDRRMLTHAKKEAQARLNAAREEERRERDVKNSYRENPEQGDEEEQEMLHNRRGAR